MNKITVEVDTELEDLVPRFLANRQADLGVITGALERADFDAIRTVGHNMKGVGGGYGFHDITTLGVRLEAAARIHDPDGILDCLEVYRDYLSRVEVVFV